jgi:hypothetical protein
MIERIEAFQDVNDSGNHVDFVFADVLLNAPFKRVSSPSVLAFLCVASAHHIEHVIGRVIGSERFG